MAYIVKELSRCQECGTGRDATNKVYDRDNGYIGLFCARCAIRRVAAINEYEAREIGGKP